MLTGQGQTTGSEHNMIIATGIVAFVALAILLAYASLRV
jgi:hypothetical protein